MPISALFRRKLIMKLNKKKLKNLSNAKTIDKVATPNIAGGFGFSTPQGICHMSYFPTCENVDACRR
jgi:hypothetical protein